MAKSFIATMTEVFKRPGQSAMEFMKEIKELDDADRRWYRAELIKSGYVITDAIYTS